MRRLAVLVAVIALAGAACRQAPDKVTEYEWSDAAGVGGAIEYPGAAFLSGQTDLLRRARAALNPGTVQCSSGVAVFDTDAPFETVVAFYSAKYAAPTPAFRTGDLAADATALAPVLAKIGVKSDPAGISGAYRVAILAGEGARPTVSVQRPYRDVLGNRVVDRTLIVLTPQ